MIDSILVLAALFPKKIEQRCLENKMKWIKRVKEMNQLLRFTVIKRVKLLK